MLITLDKLVQGNLVDIQTHDKLSLKTGRYSTTTGEATQQKMQRRFACRTVARIIEDKKAEKKLLLR
ncbi:hypothetical protein CIAM_28680 [Citrobacter amalonaticus]|nr:hypothetical protein CIAM_28680 [Citrobacter amalonaticus]